MFLKDCKPIFFILVLLLPLIFLFSCHSSGQDKAWIYEDDERLSQDGDSYHFHKRTEQFDENTMKIQFQGFYGVQTLGCWELSNSDTLNITLDSQIRKGAFKVVLISPEQEVQILEEQSGESSIQCTQGRQCLKIVGINAQGSLQAVVSTDSLP